MDKGKSRAGENACCVSYEKILLLAASYAWGIQQMRLLESSKSTSVVLNTYLRKTEQVLPALRLLENIAPTAHFLWRLGCG